MKHRWDFSHEVATQRVSPENFRTQRIDGTLAAMVFRLLLIAMLVAGCSRVLMAEDLDGPFGRLSDLQGAIVPAFKYHLSLRLVRTQGSIVPRQYNGVRTEAQMLNLRGESPKRINGNGRLMFVAVQATSDTGVIDLVAVRDYKLSGMSMNPPLSKPASVFRGDIRRLQLNNENEALVRIRFDNATDYFVLSYQDGQGLSIEPLETKFGTVAGPVLPEFAQIERIEDDIRWRCNPLTTWATSKGETLWSTEVQMEGQPTHMKPMKDLLLISTSAGHSFYIRKLTGQVVFYDKSILPGANPFGEIIALSQSSNMNPKKHPSYARFITALVALDDRRAIPFLIDWIEKGFGLQEKAMAVAALEKFNGNPDFWARKNPEPGQMQLHWVGMDRLYPDKNRQAEISKWREIFRDELTAAE